ncbi:MAG: hypothetical protein ABR987_08280 [Terracidiphilus sp.]|jgi:hypothetical protein
MFVDLLLGLVWVAIVLLPAFVASRQPVVSHNGYPNNHMKSADQDGDGVEQGNSATEG